MTNITNVSHHFPSFSIIFPWDVALSPGGPQPAAQSLSPRLAQSVAQSVAAGLAAGLAAHLAGGGATSGDDNGEMGRDSPWISVEYPRIIGSSMMNMNHMDSDGFRYYR